MIKLKVDTELVRSNLYLSKLSDNEVLTPQIFVEFQKNKKLLEISFSSNLKNYHKLAELDLGAIILNYNQVDLWKDSNSNKIVYLLERKFDRKLSEDECQAILEVENEDNNLIIDKIISIPLAHTFLVGPTGSGKTVALTWLIRQFLAKNQKSKMVIIDRKKSDLYLLYKKMDKKNLEFVNDKNDILIKLAGVAEEIEFRRKNLIKNNKKQHFAPLLVVIDEYISLWQSFNKKDQEKVKNTLTEILVIGRELNCHLWLSQQSPTVEASGLSTYLKNQFQVNIFLRPSMTNKIALETLFGKGVITSPFVTSFEAGEGLCQNLILLENNKTSVPRQIAFPGPGEF